MTEDPFGTAGTRERVLASWTAAPVRFREDANAEEDLALGGYRDRVIVELAQNAADAAVHAGVPGRLLLRLDEIDGRAVLVAANTGAPLDATGVQALATLRASAKREPLPGGGSPEAPAAVPPRPTVGRFGVGFSAVLAVTDEPAILSRHGGVRFSAADTRDLVSDAARRSPALADELARRDGHVPVLRLPFPAEGVAPEGYDTAVLLPLRDAAAEDLVRRLLADVADPLLLALPGLDAVTVEVSGEPERTVRDAAARWHVLRRDGRFDAAVLADRPTEERLRTSWSLAWALPRDPDLPVPGVVHAPTPSDEPLPWPALLIATFPLDPARRHVAPGPATDALVVHAATAYADLLAERAGAGDAVWPLVPVGLPSSALDAALRRQLTALLPATPLLPAGNDPTVLLRPRDAVALDPPAGADPDVVAGLARFVAGLVVAPRRAAGALTALGVTRTSLADVVDELPAVADPDLWRRTYGLLVGLADDPRAREALASLPVPLADGRVVRGVRGLVVPSGPPELPEALADLGIRAVHPDAAHPLLERLGAMPVGPGSALQLPAVRELVAASADGEGDLGADLDAGGLVDAVLTLVAAAVATGELQPGDLPWLAGLWLADDDGEAAPAGELVLPGSVASRLLDADTVPPVDPELVRRWGGEVLAAAGVLDGLALLHNEDVPLPPGDAGERRSTGAAGPTDLTDPGDLDGWDEWAALAVDAVALTAAGSAGSGSAGSGSAGSGNGARNGTGAGARAGAGAMPDAMPDAAEAAAAVVEAAVVEFVAVRDLDAVRDDAWPELLELIATHERLRPAVVNPVRVLARTAGGGSVAAGVPSYTAWWLNRRLAGGRPWADPAADPGLAAVLPPAPPELAGLDVSMRRALGGVARPEQLDSRAVTALLDGLADPERDLDAAGTLRLWSGLARLAAVAPDLPSPDRVRVLEGAATRVVDAADAVVVDTPILLQRTDLGLPVVAATPGEGAALAQLFDLPLAQDLVDGEIDESGDAAGSEADVPDAARALLPEAPATWCEHDELLVDGVEVEWWVEPDGSRVHASTMVGLAYGLSWAAGSWHRRAAVAEALLDPHALPRLIAEEAFTWRPSRSGE